MSEPQPTTRQPATLMIPFHTLARPAAETAQRLSAAAPPTGRAASKVYIAPPPKMKQVLTPECLEDSWYVKYADGSELRFMFPPDALM